MGDPHRQEEGKFALAKIPSCKKGESFYEGVAPKQDPPYPTPILFFSRVGKFSGSHLGRGSSLMA